MSASYRFDPSQSRFTIQAFATGLLAFAGHNPTFEPREFRGVARLDHGRRDDLSLELDFKADDLELIGHFSDADRREIEARMRRDVLQVADHPDIAFHAEHVVAAPVEPGRSRIRIDGRLSLHGVEHDHSAVAELQVIDGAIRLLGACPLRLSDYRIAPVSALGGAIHLKDELRLSFDLIALQESP